MGLNFKTIFIIIYAHILDINFCLKVCYKDNKSAKGLYIEHNDQSNVSKSNKLIVNFINIPSDIKFQGI